MLTIVYFMLYILNIKVNITNTGAEPARQMAYREKVTWLSLGAIAVAFVPYFTIVALRMQNQTALVPQLELYTIAVAVQLMVLAAGYWYLRRQSPADAAMPPDERDTAIANRSTTTAYYVDGRHDRRRMHYAVQQSRLYDRQCGVLCNHSGAGGTLQRCRC
jgi:hypothetical protein